jgi:hypothetical protein
MANKAALHRLAYRAEIEIDGDVIASPISDSDSELILVPIQSSPRHYPSPAPTRGTFV